MRVAMYARVKFAEGISTVCRRVGKRNAVGAVCAAVLVLFWDSLLPLLGHGLHVLVEVVELALEHALEKLFGLSPRQAQTVLAWSALGLVLYGAAWALLKAHAAALRTFAALKERWAAFIADEAAWFKLAVAAGALGVAVYLFT